MKIVVGLTVLWSVSWLISVYVIPVTIDRPGQTEMVPPGWEWVDRIVSAVWFVLMSLMVASAWATARSGRSDGRTVAWLIAAYIAFCLSYVAIFGWTPVTGLFGNIVTIIISLWLGRRVYRVSRIASIPIWLSTVWVTTASVYLVELIRYNRIWS